jgi:hypothetical protein
MEFYGDYVKMCKDFAPNSGDKKTGCCIRSTHCLTFPFSQGNLSNMTPSPMHSAFLRLKIKLKGRHFDTIEVIEAESQAVLNTLANTTSRMHLKDNRSAGNGAYAQNETTSRVMVTSRSKVGFWPDDSASTGNYGWLFILIYHCHEPINLNIHPFKSRCSTVGIAAGYRLNDRGVGVRVPVG